MRYCAIAVTLLSFSLHLAADAQSIENREVIRNDLFSTDSVKESNEKQEERKTLIAKWISLAQKAEDGQDILGPEFQAIEMLGEYRATEAVPMLIEKINCWPTWGRTAFTESLPREKWYPCVRALIKIGLPSDLIVEVLELLRNSPDPDESKLALYVIREVYGPEQCIAVLNSYARGQTREQKRLIADSVKYLRKWEPHITPPGKNPFKKYPLP